MIALENFHRGLLYISYLLMHSDDEISDNELYYLHKMRIQEGISDASFSEYFKSLIGKSEKEIYQNGIELINRCPDELKLRAISRLYYMAKSDNVFRPKELRFILYAIKFTRLDLERTIESIRSKEAA